jgi:hypothetical protein
LTVLPHCIYADLPTFCRDKGNHLKAPSGVGKVKEKHGIGQTKIAEESWRKFRVNGNANTYETPEESLGRGIVTLDMTLSSGRPPYTLPVSFSRHGKITEFEDTIEVEELDFKGKDRNSQFPCITGDWTGSGNAEFLKRLNLGPHTKDAGRSGELSERLCKSFPPHHSQVYFFSIVLESWLRVKGCALIVFQARSLRGRRHLLPISS